MSHNRLSVIIPVRNRAALICRTLDSILAQTVAPEQVIVVDNNSTDNTMRKVERWKQQYSPLPFEFVMTSEKTPGACAARNHGAGLASGNLLLFFDSDDTMRPMLVKKLLKAFTDSDTQIVYWRRLIHKLNNKIHLPKWSKRPTLDMQVFHSLFNTICYAVRKELFVEAGKWNDALPCWNDWELGIRLHLLAGENRIKGIDEILADGFLQEESITGTGFLPKYGKWEKAIEAATKHTDMLPAKKRKHFLRSLSMKHAVLAAHYRKEGGREQADETMKQLLKKNSNDTLLQIILKTAYRYSASGLRGVYTILGNLI